MARSTFHSMKAQLSKMYGTNSQASMIYAMGKEVGQRNAIDIVKRFPNEKPEGFITRVLRLQQILGWGRFEILSSEPKRFVVRAYECAEHIETKNEIPQCDYITGFLAGLCGGVYGMDAEASELKCVNRGDPYCEIRVSLGELPD
ncbi:MAG: V4R domain-containing protein [Nitrososphaerales archaeon]